SPVLTPMRMRTSMPVSVAYPSRVCCIWRAARTARSGSSSWATGAPKRAMMPSPMILSTRPPWATTSETRRSKARSIMFLTCSGPWVVLEGRAELVRLPEAMDLLVSYYRHISGEHPDWDDYRAAMARDQRLIIRVTVERAGPTHHG